MPLPVRKPKGDYFNVDWTVKRYNPIAIYSYKQLAMSSIELKAYHILKNKLGEQEASVLIEYFESKAGEKYKDREDVFSTKEDIALLEARLTQRIYTANMVQFIATIASILAIMKFMVK